MVFREGTKKTRRVLCLVGDTSTSNGRNAGIMPLVLIQVRSLYYSSSIVSMTTKYQ